MLGDIFINTIVSMQKNSDTTFFEKHAKIVSVISILVALLIAVLALVYRSKIAELNQLGYVGLMLLAFIGNATIIFPIPGLLSAFIGGGIFHPVLVGVFGAVGAALGELTGYFAGYGGNAVIRDNEKFKKIEKHLHKHGAVGICVLASIPNPFFDMVGIAAGISRLPIATFLIATFIGQFIKYTLFSYLGLGSVGLLSN